MLRCIRSDSLPMQCPNLPIGRPGFLLFSNFHDKGRGREGGAAAAATFFGTTSDTGHLTVGVSLRQIAGDMTQFSRIYNTVNVASNQGRSVPEGEEGPVAAEGKDGKCKSDCSGTTPVFGIKFMISLAPSRLTLRVRVLGYASTVEAAMKRTATAAATARARLIVTLLIA